MKRLLIWPMVLLLLLASISCSPQRAQAPIPPTGSPEGGAMPAPAPAPSMPRAAPPPMIAPTPTPSFAGPTGPAGEPSQATDRMVVRSGQISLVVQDIPAALDQIARLAGRFQGYVVSSRSWREGNRLRGSISIRVSAGDFDSVMKSLAELAVEATSQNTSSRDVTDEYVDLTSRLKNLQAAEEQLLKIMAKAEKVEDVLNVQRELTRVRGEVEQTKGRMQYLERTSATSLIDVSLEQAKLSAQFTADKAQVKIGEAVSFSPRIAGGFAPYSYDWDFGDGGTSNLNSPSHAYKSDGSYTVSLKVTDDRTNTVTETRKDYITVTPGWSAGDTVVSAWQGLITFGKVLLAIAIWLIIFIPVWVIGGGIFLWWRRRRRKKA